MADFTALATKVYKDPLTLNWANSIKENFDNMINRRVVDGWIVANFTASNVFDTYNVDTITKGVAGKHTITFLSGFSSNTYVIVGNGYNTDNTVMVISPETGNSVTAASFTCQWRNVDGGVSSPDYGSIIFIGTGSQVA